MGLPNAEETALLGLVFNGDAWPNLAQNTASSPYTDLWLNLATSDPGEAANQTTNEAAFGDYERVDTNRASGAGGWAVASGQATLVDTLTSFPQASGGSETESHFGIGGAASGTGRMIVSGTVTPPLVIVAGTTAQLTNATAVSAL